MNVNLRRVAVVSAVAGSLALTGCLDGETKQKTVTNRAGEEVWIQATPLDKSCLVSVSKHGVRVDTNDWMHIQNMITDPTEIKNILADNQGVYRKLINDTCGPDKKIKVLVEQDITELQRQ